MKSISGVFVPADRTMFKGRVMWDEETKEIIAIEEYETGGDYEFNDDCLIFPGFIDRHTHPREYPLPKDPTPEDIALHEKHLAKNDFRSLSEAAIMGGITYLGCVLNTPRPATNKKIYEEYKPLAEKSLLPVLLYGMIAPGSEPIDEETPHKFMWSSVGGAKIDSDAVVHDILRPYVSPENHKVYHNCYHPESIDVLKELAHKEEYEDKRGYPVQEKATEILLSIQKQTGCIVDFFHVSTNKQLELIVTAMKSLPRIEGPIFAEACIHHLLLDRNARKNPDLKYRDYLFMNPTLQHAEDKTDLIPHLGAPLHFVSSDDAGHTLEDKANGAAGITGTHVMGYAAADLIVKHKIPEKKIAKIFAVNPGKFIETFTKERIGDIKPGYKANFTVLNLKKPIKMSDEHYTPKCGWNPWAGYEFAGRVEATFVNGERKL